MCGILGWLHGSADADVAQFTDALNTLTHRGPDDSGVEVLPGILMGHRRLSIIDLSSAGHQPMTDPASGAVLVFNGEIYNHIELRTELESAGFTFRGGSDSEVLLYALVHWGEAALARLNGMWAFALWDPHDRHLLLARDRFGVKPLYYREGENGFAFASEPKALLHLFPEHRRPNRDVLLDFLVNNSLYTGHNAFYDGIRMLPPAHLARISEQGTSIERYWNYPEAEEPDCSAGQAIDEFDALLSDAVRLRLRSDVPVGLTLSGGLDSTAILAAVDASGAATPRCFTSVYSTEESGELSWARLACESAHADLEPVAAPREAWLDVMRQVTWHMDGPGYSPAVYPLWQLMKQARASGVPVLLEGQGADEELAGYPQYTALELLAYLRGRYAERRSLTGVRRRVTEMRAAFSLRWAVAWVAREMLPGLVQMRRRRIGFESLLRPEVTNIPTPWRSSRVQHDPVRGRLMDDHAERILPGLLHYGDAISMAHSVEARHPFLDYRLVEWLFRLPTRFKLHQGETKWVLREYLRSHNQQAIGNRRDKKGYPTPVGSWLATDAGREIESTLLAQHGLLHEWCEPAAVKRLLDQNRQGVMGVEHHLYKLLSTRIWLRDSIEEAVAA